MRSPDASWLRKERWDSLSSEEQESYAPLCPDFVVELRSPTDQLDAVRRKMGEYLDNGAELGWLIDPIEKRVYVYRQGEQEECLDIPETVSGDPLLPGFVLHLKDIW
jgi:Uma2 family endonuclease